MATLLLLSLTVLYLPTSRADMVGYRCGDVSWYLDESSDKCYKLTDDGAVTLNEAFTSCLTIPRSLPAKLVPVTTQSELISFGQLCEAVLKITPMDEGPGAWMPYKRFEPAPKDSSNFMSRRANKDAYKLLLVNADNSMGESTEVLNHDLWRQASAVEERAQPGDKDDERDEQCTALKNVASPEQGLDSYPCSAYQLHYAVCVKLPIGYPAPAIPRHNWPNMTND